MNRNYAYTTGCPWSLNLFPVETSPFAARSLRTGRPRFLLIHLLSNVSRLRTEVIKRWSIVLFYIAFHGLLSSIAFSSGNVWIYRDYGEVVYVYNLTLQLSRIYRIGIRVPKFKFVHQRLGETKAAPLYLAAFPRISSCKHEGSLEKNKDIHRSLFRRVARTKKKKKKQLLSEDLAVTRAMLQSRTRRRYKSFGTDLRF